MSVGTLEEVIDENHAIVSTSVGSEHYVSILSFVDKDLLEPGCTVLMNHKVCGSRLSIGCQPDPGADGFFLSHCFRCTPLSAFSAMTWIRW